MSAELQDLGKQLIIYMERGTWIVLSDTNTDRVTIRGNIKSIEQTLEQALATIRNVA